MRHIHRILYTAFSLFCLQLQAQEVHQNLAYAENGHERQVLDIFSTHDAKNRPVVFWIHGGGWQAGDKSQVSIKPKAFVEKGFVFVSTNYRLLPHVDMETIISDVAKSVGWVHRNISRYGGDPDQILIMGHSAGAQLAAILCTDPSYLNKEGVNFKSLRGCVPVDGDTYDIPAMIETAETRARVHQFPPIVNGHRVKFGNDPAKHKNFSAVTHITKDKSIPPFLIMHVADHPDTSAQAKRLANVLKSAQITVQIYSARGSNHGKINNDIGLEDDDGTKKLFEFLSLVLKD